MNYNLFFKILLFLAIITTIAVFCVKPKLHTTVLVYNSAYTIVEPKVEKIVEKNIPTTTQETQKRRKIDDVVNTVQLSKNNEVSEPKASQKTQTKDTSKKKIEQTKTAPQKVVATQPKKTETKQALQLEEEIAWNVWRSNLQNSIMRDTNLPFVEHGTVFKFTFEVDKFGRVSNVKTWSLTPSYTPFAIEYIAPVIRSYQGKSILNFPTGSARLTTKVEGGWKIAGTQHYSTPKDYQDIEKVSK